MHVSMERTVWGPSGVTRLTVNICGDARGATTREAASLETPEKASVEEARRYIIFRRRRRPRSWKSPDDGLRAKTADGDFKVKFPLRKMPRLSTPLAEFSVARPHPRSLECVSTASEKHGLAQT